jgi:hypothetical protein
LKKESRFNFINFNFNLYASFSSVISYNNKMASAKLDYQDENQITHKENYGDEKL